MEDSSDSKKKTMEEDEKKVEALTDVWWWVSGSLGAVLALVVSAFVGSWLTKFIISACVMGFIFMLFLSGVTCYQYHKDQNEPSGSSLVVVFRVVKAAISNRHLPMIKKIDSDPVTSSPEIPCTRWIDKAISSILTGEAEEETVCTATQVKEVKELIGMIPMWAIFFLYCIVKATGSTFFVLQFDNLDPSIGGFKVPLIAFFLIQPASEYTIKYLYQLVVQKWWSNAQPLRVMKVKIGLGIWCSFLSCVTARLVEARRLSLIEERGYGDYDDQTINMSVFWLAPQFCLLGFMQGLTEDGVVDFYYYKVAASLKSYGPSFNEFVIGIGKFISVFYVLTFKTWFGHTINSSHLDNYYGILAILSLGNLVIIYGYVSVYVYRDVEGEDKSLHSTMEEVVTQADAAE
ncbi:unnamed protein product [Ilex paraguariensis]|uniref:Uncharacterized protein n=1 Tax=Ilex paraguariensis TaxID=185542 RepID=A0ABC8R5F4_9AQUA